MDVAAVIPNWNGRKLLPSILADLKKQTNPPTEVIVVDNGSTDGSAELAEEAGARVIRLEQNLGFAVAVNRGVASTGVEIVAILNNDVRLPPDWLHILVQAFDGPGVAFATGKIVRESDPGTIDGTFDALSKGGTAWRCGEGKPDGPIWNIARSISMAPFTALLVNRAVYVKLGGLDEAFGTYLEDVEFGLRCASNRHTGRYIPSAVASHIGSATWGRWNPQSVRAIAKNQVLLVARHYPQSALIRFGWSIAVAQVLWGLVALRHGTGVAWLTGKLEGLRIWASVRRDDGQEIASVLGSSEKLIQDLQRQTGFDWYWRIYFALT